MWSRWQKTEAAVYGAGQCTGTAQLPHRNPNTRLTQSLHKTKKNKSTKHRKRKGNTGINKNKQTNRLMKINLAKQLWQHKVEKRVQAA